MKILKNTPTCVWILLSGVMYGLNSPGRGTQLIGMVAYFPLLIVLDRIHSNDAYSGKRRALYIFLACWWTGVIAAPIAVPGITHSIHVFGHFPWIAALLLTSFGYGLEFVSTLFVCFGIPLLFIKRKIWWDLPVRLAFFVMIEPFNPHLFRWSLSGSTFFRFPWLSQVADITGGFGLSVYNIGFCFLLLLLWRWKMESLPIPSKIIKRSVIIYLILWGIGLGYGFWRSNSLEKIQYDGPKIHIAAIQPNFSLQRLASNPDLAFSTRKGNIFDLLEDSVEALNRLPADSDLPRLLIWPESVYPSPYFFDIPLRFIVENFAIDYNTSIVLASIDYWGHTPDEERYRGISLLIGPDGQVKGQYNKIALIPYGEYIPFADWLPYYANWLRKNVKNLSEFDPGTEFTVFQLSNDYKFSTTLCFDAFKGDITKNIVRNGAEMIINLSNLAWFGKYTTSTHMEMAIWWNVIENRVPTVYVSNNGESVFMNAIGQNITEQLPIFERGSLSHTLTLQKHFSFYREYTSWVHLAYTMLFALLVILGYRKGKIFSIR